MKTQIWPALFLSLFVFPTAEGMESLEKADRYFEATLFDQAEELYLETLNDFSEDSPQIHHIKRQLARTYFIKRQYRKVADLFRDIDNTPTYDFESDSNLESLFLLGVSLNRLNDHKRSIHYLETFLRLRKRPQEIYANEAWLELGIAYFQQKKWNAAKSALQKVADHKNQANHFALAQLYITRLAIFEEDYKTAQHTIANLQDQPAEFTPYAVSFLRGELLYKQHEWEKAALEFEQALPSQSHERFQWSQDTINYLGWSYLNLGKKTGKSEFLQKAATHFNTLDTYRSTDDTKLALGQTLLAIHLNNSDESIVSELNVLLNPQHPWENRENRHHALLILAEATPLFFDRMQLLRQLTHESYAYSPYYAKGWYIKGLTELEEGERLNRDPISLKESRKYLEQATVSLGKSFDYLYPNDQKTAANALKQQVYAQYYQHTREGLLKSLSIVSRLLNQYRNDLFPQLENPDEIYFLQGLISSQLLDCDEHDTFFTIAENSLHHCIESYPKGAYAQRCLHLLGTLYLQEKTFGHAEQTFLELAKQPPPNPFAGEAWYWAAEAAAKSDNGSQKAQQYRKRVFESTPTSPFADAAFFRYHAYKEYLNGQESAMQHLLELTSRFPHSPYQMNAQYLLGLDAMQERKTPHGRVIKTSNPQKAITHFEQVADLYDQLSFPDSKKGYFAQVRYRSIIEQANAYQQLDHPELASKLLLSVYQEFQSPDHPISSKVKNTDLNDRIEDESAYLLVQSYLDQNENGKAGNILSEVLEKYHLTKTTRGYYLSRAWYQRGVLAMRQKDHLFANQCFHHAEDAAKGKVLNTDQLLDLWIQQSISYQKQGKTDEAMLLLSQVINYDAVSSERLRAMYLRAEIYENQGRKDLARRQLQATANKGGPWSLKAKEKLDKYYGYQ